MTKEMTIIPCLLETGDVFVVGGYGQSVVYDITLDEILFLSPHYEGEEKRLPIKKDTRMLHRLGINSKQKITLIKSAEPLPFTEIKKEGYYDQHECL
jgi:hypothetical protein